MYLQPDSGLYMFIVTDGLFWTSYSVTKDMKYLFWFVQQPITSHSAPEQWPSEKKTSTPKINPNESVLQLYIDI